MFGRIGVLPLSMAADDPKPATSCVTNVPDGNMTGMGVVVGTTPRCLHEFLLPFLCCHLCPFTTVHARELGTIYRGDQIYFFEKNEPEKFAHVIALKIQAEFLFL